MRQESVSLLIGKVRATKGMVRAIGHAAYALEGYGDVMELISDSLDETYTGLGTVEEELLGYRATKAED